MNFYKRNKFYFVKLFIIMDTKYLNNDVCYIMFLKTVNAI